MQWCHVEHCYQHTCLPPDVTSCASVVDEHRLLAEILAKRTVITIIMAQPLACKQLLSQSATSQPPTNNGMRTKASATNVHCHLLQRLSSSSPLGRPLRSPKHLQVQPYSSEAYTFSVKPALFFLRGSCSTRECKPDNACFAQTEPQVACAIPQGHELTFTSMCLLDACFCATCTLSKPMSQLCLSSAQAISGYPLVFCRLPYLYDGLQPVSSSDGSCMGRGKARLD